MLPLIILEVGPFFAYGFIVAVLFVLFVALPTSLYVWVRGRRKDAPIPRVNKVRRNDPWKKHGDT